MCLNIKPNICFDLLCFNTLCSECLIVSGCVWCKVGENYIIEPKMWNIFVLSLFQLKMFALILFASFLYKIVIFSSLLFCIAHNKIVVLKGALVKSKRKLLLFRASSLEKTIKKGRKYQIEKMNQRQLWIIW